MNRMTLKVILDSVRASKDEGKYYGEFLYTGGISSVQLDREQYEKLKIREGDEFEADFQMRPRSVTLFGRSVTLFEPSKFLGITPVSGFASGLPRMNQQK